MRPSPESFHFTKWYLDGVSTAGQVMIGYWAELRWRGLHLTWHSAAHSDPSGSLQEQASLTPVDPPALNQHVLTWGAPALGLSLEYRSLAPPYSLPLHATTDGSVLWHCEMPVAEVAATRRGYPPQRLTGYAERMVFSLPPWRLPIRELRWGRWIADAGRRGLVWIDWQGEERPRTWLVLDGHELRGGRVSENGVTAPDLSLKLVEPRALRSRVLSELVNRVPGLSHLLPETIMALREVRWMARGELRQRGGGSVWGTAIFEHVVMG